MYNLKMDILVNKWQEGNYAGCVATYTKNYVSYFACNGNITEVTAALYQIVFQHFGGVEASLRFLDEIKQWIDEVGVNDSSEDTYMVAETSNGKTKVTCNGNTEAFTTNFANLVCEMAHHFDEEPSLLLYWLSLRSLDDFFK